MTNAITFALLILAAGILIVNEFLNRRSRAIQLAREKERETDSTFSMMKATLISPFLAEMLTDSDPQENVYGMRILADEMEHWRKLYSQETNEHGERLYKQCLDHVSEEYDRWKSVDPSIHQEALRQSEAAQFAKKGKQ